jgi:ATPase subunit of ABC transporter with duplicated ATPase domains
VLITNSITMQFGSKPLFEDISVKFGDGNRYGLIGANGCGKSTFMKILARELDPSGGTQHLKVQNEWHGSVRINLLMKNLGLSML